MTKGTYTFKWSDPTAAEVIVTGTFDNWAQTQKLTKIEDGTHSATLEVPLQKIDYKFLVDTKWQTDPNQRVESDENGNLNNYLLVEDINPKEEPTLHIPVVPDTHDESVSPFIQSAGAGTTTAALAAEVPLEPKRDLAAEAAAKEEPPKEEVIDTTGEPVANTISSVGPESTTAALAAEVPLEEAAKDEPIVPEATKVVTAPEDLPTPGDRVPGFFPDTADAKDEESVGISPIPASETATNPITLAPNEPVPESTASVTDNVKLDEESYEKADASNLGVGATAAAAFAAVAGAISSAAASGGETIKNLIPESALPIVGGKSEPDHTTTTTDVPEVSEPEVKADVEPDHTTTTAEVPEVVIESQALADVEPEASANPEAVEAKKEVEDELVEKTDLAAPNPVTTESAHADVPDIVRESQVESGAPLEATASPEAVEAKKEIEAELKSEVTPVEPISETATEKPSETEAVPAIVAASIDKAGTSAEATANPVAVEAKHAVEEAITKGETKLDTIEPPKEEPSTAEKVVETAEKATDKIAPHTTEPPKKEEPSTEKATDKLVPESSKAGDAKSADASAPTVASTADKKKKKRVSAFFSKVRHVFKP